MKFYSIAAVVGILILTGIPGRADTITFEELSDSQTVGDFYAGVVFNNAVAHTAGISLNDAEVPPHSGSNVILNDFGPIEIDWTNAIGDFEAFFTYTAPLEIDFLFDGKEVGSETTAFNNNLALSGDAGSSPNERIAFSGHGAFNEVRIESDGAYGIDDVSFDKAQQVTPEPGTFGLIVLFFVPYAIWRVRRAAVVR